MPAKIIDNKVGTGQTTDAVTPVELISTDPLPDNSVSVIQVNFLGRNAAGAIACHTDQCTVSRQGGVLTIVSTNTIMAWGTGSSASLGGCNNSYAISGSAIVARVTGVAGETINWMADAKIRTYQD